MAPPEYLLIIAQQQTRKGTLLTGRYYVQVYQYDHDHDHWSPAQYRFLESYPGYLNSLSLTEARTIAAKKEARFGRDGKSAKIIEYC